MKPIVVIWNHAAGTADQWSELHKLLELMPDVELAVTESPEDAARTIRDASEAGCRTIVAAGGDGTVSGVIAGLATCEQPRPEFAVLPLGTGNDLSRSLEVPALAEPAWEIVRNGDVMSLDLLRVEADGVVRHVANMLTAGNTGLYMEHLTDDVKKYWGPLVYLRGVMDVVNNLETFRVRVTTDVGSAVEMDVVNLFLANGRYSGGGMVVAGEASLCDGKADLILIEEGTVGEMIGLAGSYMWDDFRNHELVHYRQVTQVEIASEQMLPFTADGDAFETRHAIIKVEPGALRVRVGHPGQVTAV